MRFDLGADPQLNSLLAALTVMMMVIGPTGAAFAAEEADVAEKAAEEEAKEAEAICIACNGSTTDTS